MRREGNRKVVMLQYQNLTLVYEIGYVHVHVLTCTHIA